MNHLQNKKSTSQKISKIGSDSKSSKAQKLISGPAVSKTKKIEGKEQSQKSITTTKPKILPAPAIFPSVQSDNLSLAFTGCVDEVPLKDFPNFHLIRQTPQIIALCTMIRNNDTSRGDFVFFSDRLFRILMEDALSYFPFAKWTISTPTGASFDGLKFTSKICGVSIMRAGESMEKALRECIPNVRIGKILVQRLEDGTAKPQHFYTKYPPDIANRMVLLMDPMLATGGSAIMALQSLEEAGVRRENIVFINMVAAPEGVRALCTKYPEVRVVSCVLDTHLNELKYIIPGLGDFGDRYFGTC